jgi:hypothetical protein
MEASDLYGLPLERFVPERTALAKALRADGAREEAARVAKLVKPSVAAWAVNQLIRTQRRPIEDLFAAGDAVQLAQRDVIAGRGSPSALRDAAERERTVESQLLDLARGLLRSEGHSLTPATLDRVSDTLHAAALDEDARREVRDGCLARELRHVGLGGDGAADAPAGGDKAKTAGARQPGASSEKKPDAAERKRREAAEREREQRRQAARAQVATASRAIEAAERKLASAHRRRDRAAATLREAEEAVSTAKSELDEASRAHADAENALDQF